MYSRYSNESECQTTAPVVSIKELEFKLTSIYADGHSLFEILGR